MRTNGRSARRAAAIAAVLSVVTMPVTAMWFLLLGGLLLVGGLLPMALGRTSTVGVQVYVGLGLLVGPVVYLSLAALQ